MIDKNKIKWIDGKCECCGCMPDDFDEDYYGVITPDIIENDDYCGVHIARLLHERNELKAKYEKCITFIRHLYADYALDVRTNDYDIARELLLASGIFDKELLRELEGKE
jgi:hypothetical protein